MKNSGLRIVNKLIYFGVLFSGEIIFFSIYIVNKKTLFLLASLILLCISFFSITIFNLKGRDKASGEKMVRKVLKIIFIIYLILLFYLVLFDKNYGRTGLTFDYTNFDEYMNSSFNIIPFVTISRYPIFSTDFSVFSTNILGNLLALAPLSFFVPILSKRKIQFNHICVIGVAFSLIIELLQLLTLSGSFDIDDIILNSSGMIFMYLVLNIPFLKKIVAKITTIEY